MIFPDSESCPVCDNGSGGSEREETEALIRRLERDNPQIAAGIFSSLRSVNIETLPGFKKNGIAHLYLEEYNA